MVAAQLRTDRSALLAA